MIWICATCAVETADLDDPPRTCEICADDRQWVPASGQRWTTLADLAAAGTTTAWFEVEPDLYGVTAAPQVGIGQQTMVLRTTSGVIVLDPLGFIDDAVVAHVRGLGPVLAVAASHPHMYGCQTEWAAALEAPVVLNVHDREWCRRPDRVTFFDDSHDLGADVTLHRVGGHFRGQTVAEWRPGNDGRGVLFAGDAVFPNPDRRGVSFLRGYPNRRCAVRRRGAADRRPARGPRTSTGCTTTSVPAGARGRQGGAPVLRRPARGTDRRPPRRQFGRSRSGRRRLADVEFGAAVAEDQQLGGRHHRRVVRPGVDQLHPNQPEQFGVDRAVEQVPRRPVQPWRSAR